MFEKLAQIEEKYNSLEQKMADPATLTDINALAELSKEAATLTPIVTKYHDYKRAEKKRADALAILAEAGDDEELTGLAREECDAAAMEMARLESELQRMLLPKNPDDEKNVIIEIRAGAGGEEAALFARSLYRMYSMAAQLNGWQKEVLSTNETGLGGYKEISFTINGTGAYAKLKYESGVHRVQRVPETESGGRIHTSTVTVAVLPEADDVMVEIDPNDLKIDVYRSSGAGGQHVNKTESAVRITHLPSGLVVECQDERSQQQNRERAMKILRARLYEQKLQAQNDKIAADRRIQVGTGDRSERIRTYNFPQGRCTDHRIGLTLYNLDEIMNGRLDALTQALGTADEAARLAANKGDTP